MQIVETRTKINFRKCCITYRRLLKTIVKGFWFAEQSYKSRRVRRNGRLTEVEMPGSKKKFSNR